MHTPDDTHPDTDHHMPSDTSGNPAPAGRYGKLPGLLFVLLVAVVATGVGTVAPVVGAPIVAIVLGIVLRVLFGGRPGWAALRPGTAFAARYLLQAAVVVFGLGLSLATVARIGLRSLPVMLGTLAVCLLGAWLIGRLMRVSAELRALIGSGTGICGASAIAAVSPVVAASEAAVGYAISTIFLYNVVAAVAFPALGHLIGLSDHGFGLWAGTAVNDTSSVVAAGFTYSTAAGHYAVVVKLVRSLMIVPVVLGLAALWRRRTARAEADGDNATGTGEAGTTGAGAHKPLWRLVPAFLWLFVAAAAVNSLGLVPHAAHGMLATLATFLVATALAGVGTGIDIGQLRRAGAAPLLLGGILWLLVAVSSLGFQALSGGI